ncbi:MAG: type II secretion system F family protein [Planctomycetota bacterium]
MPTFAFEAVDGSGRSVSDTIEASSIDEARSILRKKKLFPTNIAQKRTSAQRAVAATAGAERKKSTVIGRVKNVHLTLFTRQFATLVEAGLPIVRSLAILEEMIPNGVLRNSLMDVRDDVEQGSSLSEAMAKQPKSFDTLYVSMVRAGEMGGVLDTILMRLAEFREKSQKLKKQIVSALIYPTAVLTIATSILLLIITYIIPKFRDMFEGMGVELPTMTQMLMQFADILKSFWYAIPLVPIGFFLLFKLIRSTKQGRYATDLISLYLPVFGIIIRKTSISRFCRTLGTLTSSGVPILDALAILKSAVGNAVVEGAVMDVHNSIREGESIAEPLKRSGVFDVLSVNMVAVGEETGELDKMLIKVADSYDSDVDAMVTGMMSLLEPFLIIGMGLVAGFIVISLFLPLVKMIETLA